MQDKFLPYKLITDVYPMRPQFYSPFKGEKYELPKYKRHWNFIQFSTKMLVERIFGIPLCHMLNLVMACICLHNMCISNLDGFDMD